MVHVYKDPQLIDDDFQIVDDDYCTYDADDAVSDDDGLTAAEVNAYNIECRMFNELKRRLIDVLGYIEYEIYKTCYV